MSEANPMEHSSAIAHVAASIISIRALAQYALLEEENTSSAQAIREKLSSELSNIPKVFFDEQNLNNMLTEQSQKVIYGHLFVLEKELLALCRQLRVKAQELHSIINQEFSALRTSLMQLPVPCSIKDLVIFEDE